MPEFVEARLRRIYQQLDEALLGAPENEELTEEDVALAGGGRSDRIFGVYTRRGLHAAFTAYGSFRRLEARLGGPVELRVELDDPFRPRITFWSVKHDAPAVDVTLSLTTGESIGLSGSARKARLVYLEDIVIENPGSRFDWSRPPLPDQRHPGLGVAREALALIVLLTRRVGAEGLALRPVNFHVARIYSRIFLFVNPTEQGRLEAILEAGRWVPNWLLAWAVATGSVRYARGRAFVFKPSPMVCPLTDSLAAWFSREPWRRARAAAAQTEFRIDLRSAVQQIPWERFPQFPPPAPIARLLTEMLPRPPG